MTGAPEDLLTRCNQTGKRFGEFGSGSGLAHGEQPRAFNGSSFGQSFTNGSTWNGSIWGTAIGSGLKASTNDTTRSQGRFLIQIWVEHDQLTSYCRHRSGFIRIFRDQNRIWVITFFVRVGKLGPSWKQPVAISEQHIARTNKRTKRAFQHFPSSSSGQWSTCAKQLALLRRKPTFRHWTRCYEQVLYPKP